MLYNRVRLTVTVIMEDGKSGFENNKGNFVFEADFYIDPEDIGPRKYPSINHYFNEGYVLVKNKNHKWIQYNKKGKMVNLPENIEPVSLCYVNGFVPVLNRETKKCGYMNSKFEIVISFEFGSAKEFVGKYACVRYENKDALIHRQGNIYFVEDL